MLLLLLFISGYFIQYTLQKSRKLQSQLFGGHFGIMTVQYCYTLEFHLDGTKINGEN